MSKRSDDTISRQDALKPFCIAPDGTRIPEVDCDNFPVEFSVEFIKKHLLSLPSAEPKTGKWLFDKDGYFRCEVCGKKPNDQNTTTDYCPHCGARLGGDTE